MATFYNQATLSYSGGVVNSNITRGELREVLSVTKTAVVDEYSRNSDVTYAVNIINSGNSAFTGLSIRDDLGAYTSVGNTLQPLDYVDGSVRYFVNGVLQASPTVTVGNFLVFSGINIPANGVATLLYTTRTNGFAPLEEGSSIENTVVVRCSGIASVTATETINVSTEPELLIVKSLDPTTVTESDRLTYTIIIQNIGNTAATVADNAVVTDIFNPILSDIVVTYNGNIWTESANYTYNETTGLFQTVSGQITVPAATYSQNPENCQWIITPGTVTLTVTGMV